MLSVLSLIYFCIMFVAIALASIELMRRVILLEAYFRMFVLIVDFICNLPMHALFGGKMYAYMFCLLVQPSHQVNATTHIFSAFLSKFLSMCRMHRRLTTMTLLPVATSRFSHSVLLANNHVGEVFRIVAKKSPPKYMHFLVCDVLEHDISAYSVVRTMANTNNYRTANKVEFKVAKKIGTNTPKI